MRKKNKLYYMPLIILFLVFILASSINKFLIMLNPNINNEVIINEEYKLLEEKYNDLLLASDFLKENNLDLIISQIKYRNIYNFKDEITIYKGYLDGVEKDSPVITRDGLIGIVNTTYKHTSVVRLITNQKSNISVKINDSYGILKYQNNTLIVDNLSNYAEIEVGDLIYTSGIGNLPGDIYIGMVKDITLNNTDIEKIVQVDLAANIDNINYLYILRR